MARWCRFVVVLLRITTAPGYDRNIYSRDELNEKIKYINENPVARRLVCRPEDWRWSSAGWWRGMENQMIEMDRF